MWTKTLFIIITAAALGCSATGNGQQQRNMGGALSATIADGAGKTLYFNRFTNNAPAAIDSVVLDANGKGSMQLPALPMDFYALTISGGKDLMVLLLDSTESLSVAAKADSISIPTSLEGSVNTALLQGYFTHSRAFDRQRNAFVERLNANPQDTAAMAQLNAISMGFNDHTKGFVQDHIASPAVLAALNRLDIRTEMPLFSQAREALRNVMPNSAYYASFNEQVGRAEQQAQGAKLQEEQQAQLDNLLPIGSVAPDFSQNSPDGKPIKLSSLRGKVVLIDFWASWCRPCRMENPNVKRVYDRFHNKGFEIIGVSLDRDKDAWTGAIAQDGLPWKHVSDLAFWNNAAAQLYGVSSIPYTVLLDREGKVIAKNLRGPALEAKLAEVLK
ncbi:MAG: TlpA family protein disulfide reductase [Flavobacteriales bacterium]|jgi:peroxiredoxin|nr:TlpA family protein disulfide reductase [Flavobacteriales bacterium]MCI1753764.1 TlpA family protein disulfide reductase [Flavobacteriales bacterium]